MVNTVIRRALVGQFVLIAEIGVNYYDIARKMNITPLKAAKLMVKKARDAGVHAVKFQSYKAGTLAARESPSYWDTSEEATTSQYELFRKYDRFSFEEYKELSQYCEEIGIEFLSTAFDIDAADYLYELMNVYKISSSDLSNLPFIEYQAQKGKPILLSTGASNEEEIDQAVQLIRKYNDQPLVLMHCVLEYPTPYAHANLNKIGSLKHRYPNLIIGYSDHTKPDDDADVVKTAYSLGAIVVEKHFTLDKTLSGNDHYHAMNPEDARKILKMIDFIDEIRGSYEIKCLDTELPARRNARRSLVAACDIKKGEVFTKEMLTFKRPGTGISSGDMMNIIGRTALKDIAVDTLLHYEMIG